jgi:FKBP-type peptidyl-prolyl cis-trans isomerase FkpA
MKYRILFFLSVVLASCSTDSTYQELLPTDFKAQNEAQINAYLEANNLVSQKTSSGLHYIIENQGDGDQPTTTDNVTVAYKGYFLDGTVFDESDAEGITTPLNQVIPGWTEGIPLFNEGGSGTLLIPAHLGYGSFNVNGIPGGTVLVFDVTLISVN